MSDSEQRKSQLERFKEAARQLETDDDEERFNKKLRKMAKQKPLTDDSESEPMGEGEND